MLGNKLKQKYDFSELVDTSTSTSGIANKKIDEIPDENLLFKTPSTNIAVKSCSTKLKTSSSLKRFSSTTCTSSSRVTASSVIIALAEGRGLAKGEIGIASIELKNPELVLSQFPDRQTYIKTLTKLYALQPLEVIVPNTAFETGRKSGVLKRISDNFPKTSIVSVQRIYFNEVKGLEYIKRLSIPECKPVEMLISDKYYALAAAAALIKYVEFIQNIVYASKSLKVEYAGGENTTMIDMKTCINLELLLNLNDPKSDHTLFGVLHNTRSVGGTRLLRANILQPPFCQTTIDTRLECVQELFETKDLLDNLQAIIGKFVDVDHLLSLCAQIPKVDNVKTAENKINNILHLKHTLELIEPLASALQDAKCSLLRSYRKMLVDDRYDDIYKKICKIIQFDAKHHKTVLNMRDQRCFAVKPNINGLLDIARRSYSEIIDDITSMAEQLGKDYGLPIRVAYNCSKGFFIHISMSKKSKLTNKQLPAPFIKIIRNRNSINCTTNDLMKLNVRVEESLSEIYLMSNVIVSKLLEDITQQIGCFYKLTEIVSTLDMLLAFARAATVGNYTKPEFTNTLAIKHGRHPILDRIASVTVTPNCAFLCNDVNVAIITGPNMSGKSTYLKQILLLQIMAQMGSYVPAEYASFRLADHVYSRIGNTDDIETNTSTFMMEMKEMNYITSTVTDSCLIVIDELGRGTSVEEGIGICQAICEFLLETKAFVLFATHFMELTNLESVNTNVTNCCFNAEKEETTDGNFKFKFSHTIEEGKSQEKNYGIRLAEITMPQHEIITCATEIANCLTDRDQCQKGVSDEKEEKTVVELTIKLRQIATNSTLDATELKKLLEELQYQFQFELEHLTD